MTNKKKTIKELTVDLDRMSERVLKLERLVVEYNINEVTEKIDKFETLIKGYDKKIKNTKDGGLNGKSHGFRKTCNNCGLVLVEGNSIQKHKKEKHGLTFKCKLCKLTFVESWKMEEHLKSHVDADINKCSICEKEFVVKWRLDKHVLSHTQNNKYCHCFNNGTICPFQNIGCKFRHEDAPPCRFQSRCNFNLCQFQHVALEEILGIDSSELDDIDDEEVMSSYEDDDACTDYENEDYDKIDEIGLRDHMYKDCGACSKVLTVQNSFKCKKCGQPTHRSNCNNLFNTVARHHYCGGCVYDFKPMDTAS